MAICDTDVSANIDFNCDTSGGIEPNVYIFNREQIAAFVKDVSNTQIVTDITMAVKTAGEPPVLYTGYLFEGVNTSVKPKATLAKKTYASRFDHVIDFVVFDRNAPALEQLEAMKNGKYVCIVESLNKAGNGVFRIYGMDIGLVLTGLTDDPTNADNEGAILCTLGSPDTTKEPHMPAIFYETDYATTKTLLLSLLAA